MNEMADGLANVHRFQTVEVRQVSVEFEVVLLTNRVFDVTHQDAPLAVKAMLVNVANPLFMYLVVNAERHRIDEEVASVMIQWFCLTMMFNCRAVFAIDVQDDFAVKDVVKSQQWSFDVADVELNGEADVVAHEQDVFVATMRIG